jgi:PAS domain S-box-containing protein
MRIIFLVVFLFFTFGIAKYSNAQTEYPLSLQGYLKKGNTALVGVSIKLYYNNDVIYSGVSKDEGWFGVKPQLDGDYKLEFSFNGYVTQFLNVSTNMPDGHGNLLVEYQMGDIAMLEFVEGSDLSIFKNPIRKIQYYPDQGKYMDDKDYQSLMNGKIQNFIKQSEKLKNNSDLQESAKDYNDLIAKADNEFQNGQLVEAKDLYEKAISLKDESYPKEQIKKIDKLLEEEKKTLIDNELGMETNPNQENPDNIVSQQNTDPATIKNLEQQLNNLGDNDPEALDILVELGRKHLAKNNLDEAKNNLNKALQIASVLGDNNKKSDIKGEIALLDFQDGDYSNALDEIDDVILLKEKENDKNGMARMIGNKANMESNLYRFDDAIKNYNKALELAIETNDRKKETDLLHNLGNAYFNKGEYDKALEYFNKSLDIDKELNENANIAANYNNIGVSYHNSGNLDEAEKAYEKSKQLSEKQGDQLAIATSLNNLGNINYDWKKYGPALDFYKMSLELKKEAGYEKGEALSYHNIGNVKTAQKQYDEALENYNISNQLASKLNLRALSAKNYKAISQVYEAQDKCDLAHESYKKYVDIGAFYTNEGQLNEMQLRQSELNESGALIAQLRNEIDQQKNLFMFKNQAQILEKELFKKQMSDSLNSAIHKTEEAEKEAELADQARITSELESEKNLALRNMYLVGFALAGLAFIVGIFFYIQKKKDNKILKDQKEEIETQAVQLSSVNKELNKLSVVASETDNAVAIADPNGDIKWVNEGFTRLLGYSLIEFKEKYGNNLSNASSNKKINDLIEKAITEKQSVEYTSEAETKSGEKLWLQTTLTPVLDNNGYVTEIITIDSNVTKVKKAEQEIKKQQKELVKAFKQSSKDQTALHVAMIQIEEQKNEITDSIHYASRIQKAVLPPAVFKNESIKDYFIFNKPRDIVSGDFYWIGEVGDNLLCTVADCTGHGVPGAFMSLLGITYLNEIRSDLEMKNVTLCDPGEILNKLREKVIHSLRQTSDSNSTKDGMDMTLIVINNKENKCWVAGANNPLVHIRNHQEEKLNVVKVDKMPIGIYFGKERPFKTIELPYESGDTLYMSSDGYIDQFGGEEGKKFKSLYYRKLLTEIQDLSMKEQHNKLKTTIEEWQGDYDQIDDICVMGIEL